MFKQTTGVLSERAGRKEQRKCGNDYPATSSQHQAPPQAFAPPPAWPGAADDYKQTKRINSFISVHFTVRPFLISSVA